MERSVNVNAGLAPEGTGDEGWERDSLADDYGRHSAGDQGPCLYLGPAGERCRRKAVEGGFCLKHQPQPAQPVSPARAVRRGVAILMAVVALWPLVADVIRALIRLLR